MRWNRKYFAEGQLRKRKKFLFVPRMIGQECRWLEFAVIEEVAYLKYCQSIHGYHYKQAWKESRFVD